MPSAHHFIISALALYAAPAMAQPPAAWQTTATEYGCFTATRRSNDIRTTLVLPDGNDVGTPILIRMLFPIPGPPGPVEFGQSKAVVRAPAPPMDTSFEIDFIGNATLGPSRGLLTIRVNDAALAQLGRQDTLFDLFYKGEPLTTATVSGLAQARQQLATCRPLVPPPNRAAAPLGRPADWIETGRFDRLVREGTGRFAFMLGITPRGRAESCAIDRTTGDATADDYLCKQLIRRSRFVAATDAAARHIAGSYTLRFNFAG